jgi:hypothetical protein
MRQSGAGKSRGCASQPTYLRSLVTASCVVPSAAVCVPTADDALEAGGCLYGHVESTLLLRYDGRMEHALSPPLMHAIPKP